MEPTGGISRPSETPQPPADESTEPRGAAPPPAAAASDPLPERTYQRRRLMVDHQVQGTLVARAVLYWIAAISYFAILMFTSQWIGSGVSFSEHVMAFLGDALWWLPAMLMILPLVIFDMLRTSNRFAGPVYRLRNEMGRLADGEPVEPLRFRSGDHWHDLSEAFNRLRLAIEQAHADRLPHADSDAPSESTGDARPAARATSPEASAAQPKTADPPAPVAAATPAPETISIVAATEPEENQPFQSILRPNAVVEDLAPKEPPQRPSRPTATKERPPSMESLLSMAQRETAAEEVTAR